MYKNSKSNIQKALKNSIVECATYNANVHGVPTGTIIRKNEDSHIVGTDKGFLLWISQTATTVAGLLDSDHINAAAFEFDVYAGNVQV